ncbi:MAG: hypothetical protein KF764_12200 [Labilithrix sp.]|nr:hypothetical protein [Labilithrix sp.]
MKSTQLMRFESLYKHSQYMGAATILRGFLGLSDDVSMPLSLSHGVDCGQYRNALDVETIEPLHWSYNQDIHDTASRVKPSVMAPHPWAIVAQQREASPGRGVLLVGPPPSPENDETLYKLIARESLSDWTVLVKARGEFQGSMRYWNARGLRTITARGADGSFYERLYTILSGYRTVVGCSFSSALLFAAAIGKEVVLLRDYRWEIYEASNFLSEVWLESPRARKIVRVFADGTDQEKSDASRDLLGFGMLGQREQIGRVLRASVEELERPFHCHADNPVPYKVREVLTVMLKKQGFLRYSSSELLALLKRKQVCVLQMNDIDAWLNGRSESNCRVMPVAFRKGVTQPGWAPNGYGPEAA